MTICFSKSFKILCIFKRHSKYFLFSKIHIFIKFSISKLALNFLFLTFSFKICLISCFPIFSYRSTFVAKMLKNLPAIQEIQVQSLGWEDPLEKGMTTHSSILVWKIPWTEEPGELQSMGLQRVRHNWVTIIFKLFNYIFPIQPWN